MVSLQRCRSQAREVIAATLPVFTGVQQDDTQKLRFAAIMQGIVKRAQIGTASSADAHSNADGVKGLAEIAVTLID